MHVPIFRVFVCFLTGYIFQNPKLRCNNHDKIVVYKEKFAATQDMIKIYEQRDKKLS
jgi:hypothetical protein